MTFIALGSGSDEVKVKRNMPTVFMVEEGYKQYRGSDENDRFILKDDLHSGNLDGMRGFDTIDLGNYASSSWALLDWRGYLCSGKVKAEVTRPECNVEPVGFDK